MKKKILTLGLTLSATVLLAACSYNPGYKDTSSESSSEDAFEKFKANENADIEDDDEEESISSEDNESTITESDSTSNVSQEFKNALKSADYYANEDHMSKKRLYDQLTSEYGEQFPAEAAQYAVDNLIADYNANALEKAKKYRDMMAMSNDAIYDQLTSDAGEKFTPEEAQYAVNNLN